jgi:hypothetical protein
MDFRELMLEQKRLVLDKSVLDNFPNRKTRNTSMEEGVIINFGLSKNYNGSFGFDTIDKSFKEQLSFVNHGGKIVPIIDYINGVDAKSRPSSYTTLSQKDAVHLCVMPGKTATITMQLLRPDGKTSITFENDENILFQRKIFKTAELIDSIMVNGNSLKKDSPKVGQSIETNEFFSVKADTFNNGKINEMAISLNLNYGPLESVIVLPIYFKKGDSAPDYIGNLILYPNNPIRVPVKFVIFKTGGENEDDNNHKRKFDKYIKSDGWRDYYINNSFRQAAIKIEPEFTEFNYAENELTTFVKEVTPRQTTLVTEIKKKDYILKDEIGNEIDSDGKILQYRYLLDKLLDMYNKNELEKKQPLFRGILVFLIKYENDTNEGGEGVGIPFNANHSMLFTSNITHPGEVVHEIGHVLGLAHMFKTPPNKAGKGGDVGIEERIQKDIEKLEKETFEGGLDKKIKCKALDQLYQLKEFYERHNVYFQKGVTKYFMDYPKVLPTEFNQNCLRFLSWQWAIMRHEAKLYYSKNG